jgi:hypothetical protein
MYNSKEYNEKPREKTTNEKYILILLFNLKIQTKIMIKIKLKKIK